MSVAVRSATVARLLRSEKPVYSGVVPSKIKNAFQTSPTMIQDLLKLLPQIMTTRIEGSVLNTDGLATSVGGFPAPVGALVEIDRQTGPPLRGEVIGFQGDSTVVYPFGNVSGVRRGNRVRLINTARFVRVGESLLGASSMPTENLWTAGPIRVRRLELDSTARHRRLLTVRAFDQPLSTGIRAIDTMLTCGQGQRVGIFSGSGVGKSVTLGMMARYTSADVNVIGLIGERGREVNEFWNAILAPKVWRVA